MELFYWAHQLPFRHPFTISKGTKSFQPTLVVALQLGPFIGFGEAPAITYYDISVEKMIEDLESKRRLVEKFAFTDPERYWHYLHHLFPANPFLVCALDMAGWDLWGKMKKQPLYRLWGTELVNTPLTDYTIGIDSIEKMLAKIDEMPWPIYKVKVGIPGDIEMITAIRKHTDAILRVDANAGWSLTEAKEKLKVLHDLGVELVEQPLEKNNWEGMKELYEYSPIPLFADESCVFEQDVERCKGHFHGINIKLTKCSGITPALRMVKKARELNLKIMMGSMNESSIGTAAVVHFLPQIDFADFDGPLLLANDIAKGLMYDQGQLSVIAAPGLGIVPISFDFQQN